MKKTLLILACCLISHLAQAAEDSKYVEIWAPGLGDDDHSGWKDVNKVMTKDEITGDSQLCWAAAASNVISWWQDQNASYLAGSNAGIPQGEDEIFAAFNKAFLNKGFDSYWGLRWFMDGASEELNEESVIGATAADIYMDPNLDNRPGGFYNGIVADIVSTMDGGLQVITDDYGFLVTDVVDIDVFTDQLVDAITSGAVTLGMTGGEGTADVFGHAITLWGIKLNTETGLIESMWVTDSDDLVTHGENLGLFELICTPTTKNQKLGGGSKDYKVYAIEDTLTEGKRWYAGADGYNEYIDSFAVLRANVQWTVPEPATGTLGLLALAGLAARRRRK